MAVVLRWKQIVRQAEQLSAAFRDKPVDRLIGIEEARPCHRRDFRAKSGRAGPPVKRIVSVPQGKPLVVVLSGYKADGELAGHWFPGFMKGAPRKPCAGR